jgi:hypothetical protein
MSWLASLIGTQNLGVLAGVIILAYLVALVLGRRAATSVWDWMKDWVAPITIPMAIFLLGIAINAAGERRQAAQIGLERETAVMGEIMTSQDRRDIAHMVAVTKQLWIHLQRWESAKQQHNANNGSPADSVGPRVSQPRDYDPVALYFFSCMLRVADVQVEATRGHFLFRRVWMEDRFHRLLHALIEHLLGGESRSLTTSAQEEAAQYRYFRRDPREFDGPALWDFYLLMHASPHASHCSEATALQAGYARFARRLEEGRVNPATVEETYRAMDGLWDYVVSDVFATWYGREREALPDTIPSNPPGGFLRGQAGRNEMWRVIVEARGAW